MSRRYKWAQIIQVFEATGFSQVDRIGNECILQGPDGYYVWVPVGRDLSEDDVNRFLDANHINREDFWALHGELFVD